MPFEPEPELIGYKMEAWYDPNHPEEIEIWIERKPDGAFQLVKRSPGMINAIEFVKLVHDHWSFTYNAGKQMCDRLAAS